MDGASVRNDGASVRNDGVFKVILDRMLIESKKMSSHLLQLLLE